MVFYHKRKDEIMQSFSNHGDDIKMLKYLGHIDKGLFIEAGANNGTEQSNTKLYESELGWTGLLVEPNIHKYKDCVKTRHNSKVENYALVSPSHGKDTIKGFFQSDDHGDSLCGRVVDTGYESYKHDERWFGKGEPIEVPCITLSELLVKHDIKGSDVHFFSLDIEGYEPYALEGLDLTINRPLYMLIEMDEGLHHQSFGSNWHFETLVKMLADHEYEFVEKISPIDALYRRREG